MNTVFRRITKTVLSLFRRIFQNEILWPTLLSQEILLIKTERRAQVRPQGADLPPFFLSVAK
jgi:hypothetical protein